MQVRRHIAQTRQIDFGRFEHFALDGLDQVHGAHQQIALLK